MLVNGLIVKAIMIIAPIIMMIVIIKYIIKEFL